MPEMTQDDINDWNVEINYDIASHKYQIDKMYENGSPDKHMLDFHQTKIEELRARRM